MSATAILLRSASRRMGEAAVLAASTAFSVMAISVFAAAGSSPRFASLVSAMETAKNLFRASSVVIVFFVGLSGWFYAEHYLRRRQRELASWMLLGMGRGRAVLAISAELAAASLAALVAGLGLGALFSRFFALVLAALMSDREPLEMGFGALSIGAASAACAAQWLSSTARAALVLRRQAIARLMKAERAMEEPPRLRRARAALGFALVAAGYSVAALCRGAGASALMLPVLALVVAGTFLSFDALVPALVEAFRAGRARRDAASLIAAAQLSFRSRRNARLLAFSSVLVAVAASALGSVLALDLRDQAMARRLCPHGLELSASSPEAAARVEAILSAAGASGWERIDLEWLRGTLYSGGEEREVQVFSSSAWGAAAKALDETVPPVGPGRLRSGLEGRAASLARGDEDVGLLVGGRLETLRAYPEEAAPPLSVRTALSPVIVDDGSYDAFRMAAGARDARSSSAWDELSSSVLRAAQGALAAAFPAGLVSRPAMMDAQAGLYGVMLFIGAFLSAVFVLAAASLLAFRSIEDARDDGDRYRAIVGLGSPAEAIRKALVLQVAFAFGLPALVGLCHAAFALAMMRNITGFSNTGPTLIVSGSLVLAFALFACLVADRQEASIRSSIDIA